MKFARYAFLVSALGLWIAASNTQALVLDQQAGVNTTAGIMIAIGGGVQQQRLAQVVTAGITGRLTQVGFAGGCSIGANLILTIQGTALGKPNNVPIMSATFTGVTLPALPGTFSVVTLPSPVQFTAGDSFAIVWSTPSPADSCATFPGPVGNPYPGGDGYGNSLADPPGSWHPLLFSPGIAAGADLPFQTFVEPTYAVTYNGNGSSGGTPPVDNDAYTTGQTVTVLGTGSLVRPGYTFAGWNTAANGTGTTYPPGATFTMGSATATLYALWVAIPATATNVPALSPGSLVALILLIAAVSVAAGKLRGGRSR